MEFLEEVLAWLRSFPGLEALQVDHLDPKPDSCGLYPRGVREESRRETVVGRTLRRCRQTFLLRLSGQSKETAASRLLQFQDWVSSQQEQAPAAGEDSRVRAENGRLAAVAPSGLATYEVELIFTYQEEL